MKEFEIPHGIRLSGCLAIALVGVQFPDVDHCILAAGDETCIVIEPRDSFYGLLVSNEFKVLGQGGRVELVHPDLFVVLTGEKMATIREDNFATLLDRQLFVGDELLV